MLSFPSRDNWEEKLKTKTGWKKASLLMRLECLERIREGQRSAQLRFISVSLPPSAFYKKLSWIWS